MGSHPSEFTDKALVLRATPFNDKDLILTLLAEERGKLGIMIRSAKGGKNFKAGIPEILDVGHFSLKSGRGQLAVLRHFKPEKTYQHIRTKLASFVSACCWIEVLEFLTVEGHPDSGELFAAALSVMAELDHAKDAKECCRALCQGIDHALSLTGFGLEVSGAPPSFKKLETAARRVQEIAARPLKTWPDVRRVALQIPKNPEEIASLPLDDQL